VTLTLTLDRVTLHTLVQHSFTSTNKPNFIKIEETFCGRTDVRTYGRTGGHLTPTLLGRLRRVNLKKQEKLTPFELSKNLDQVLYPTARLINMQ